MHRSHLLSANTATAIGSASVRLPLRKPPNSRNGCPPQALYERAYQLNIVDAEKRTSFYKMLNTRRWRTKEPGDEMILPENPRLAASIGKSLKESGISESEAMSLLGVTRLERVRPFIAAATERRTHLRAMV